MLTSRSRACMLWRGRGSEPCHPRSHLLPNPDIRYSKIIPTYWVLAVCTALFCLLFPLPSYNKSPRELLFLGFYNKNVKVVTSPRSCTSSTEQDPSVPKYPFWTLTLYWTSSLCPSVNTQTTHPTHSSTCGKPVCPSWLLGTTVLAFTVSFGLALKAVPIIQQSVGQIQDNFVPRWESSGGFWLNFQMNSASGQGSVRKEA